MPEQSLAEITASMVAPGKGILAVDESNGTCNGRFEKLGIPPTIEMRQAYRELLLSVRGLNAFVSGAILYDETIRQSSAAGVPFAKLMHDAGMLPGIKVDAGTEPLAGSPRETITFGLDGLRKRVAEYHAMGARFAKWRAVIRISVDGLPSRACIEANAQALARYAALCQEGGLVPIVEPEVLMDGDHTIERCYDVTIEVLRAVFTQLTIHNVVLEHIVLKPSMVIEGTDCATRSSVEEVARATMSCLSRTVPAAVGGVAFLSGGQSNEVASAHLNAMFDGAGSAKPWPLTFSYGRALQQPALHLWKGQAANIPAAQAALYHRAMCNSEAALGRYTAATEHHAERVLVES